MSSFVFNSFKQRFLNGEVPSDFNAVFLPMNNKFIDNFSKEGFSVEQFRTINDLKKFSEKYKKKLEQDEAEGREVPDNKDLFEDSKLKYVGIRNTWHAIKETEEQVKPMYINSDNWEEFTKSEYWEDAKNNKYITGDNPYTYTANSGGFYILRTKEEFNWFANEVNEGNNGITGVLFDDVSDKISFSIGKDETIPFQGVLDGNGHALKNTFYECTGSDNGLVSVLGARGAVRNFVLTNSGWENGYPAVLKGLKQINLNYLKTDARDVNAGLLVGRNYGTIENIKLYGVNSTDFTFSFSGFIPQVYSVTNKSDDISNFTDIRKKFDNGENFYFLNSWCINSPGNICPYVGYFAEGIFAQKAVGYNINTDGSVACIDFNPKMKSYYDTGSEEVEIDLNAEGEGAPKLTLLAIFMKYDWCNDYLFTHGNDINSLEYKLNVKSFDDETLTKNFIYYDNLNYRSTPVYNPNGILYDGMTDKEIETLRSDPAWYSFNDDPRGRNAVAIVKCEYNTKTYFLELNGMYIRDTASTEHASVRFIAGSLDCSQLNSPIIDNDPGDKTYAKIDNTNKDEKDLYVSKGYAIYEGKLRKINNDVGAEKAGWEKDNAEDVPIDISDSVRAFDEDGNQIKLNSYDGFSFIWAGKRSLGIGQYSDNANEYILTNIVFNTDVDIDMNMPEELSGYKIRFASKLLNPYKLQSSVNNTQKIEYDEFDANDYKNFKNIFEWPVEPDESYEKFYANMYSSNNLLIKPNTYYSQYYHVNDYKQFIADNYRSSGLSKLFTMFEEFNKDDSKYYSYFKNIFEKVNSNGIHEKLTNDEILNTDFRVNLQNELRNNLSKYVKHEVDYTNVSYVSQKDINIPLGGDNNLGQVSRHFLFSYAINEDGGSNKSKLLKYLKNRKYQDLMHENSDIVFYKNPIDFDNENIELVMQLYMDILSVSSSSYLIEKKSGLLSLETFNYNKFQYSPFISSSIVTSGSNRDNSIFDAGAPYYDLITDTNGNIHKDWIQRAANLYVKNPVYYGLDYNGHWTSMAVRTSAIDDEDINQVNYNWNIMRAMFEGVPEDQDDPDGKLMWDGIYYEDKVFPKLNEEGKFTGEWNYYEWDETNPLNVSSYKDKYTKPAMIPNCMLNKPIRMHHMVRAAYNIAPIVGANYGTVSSVRGNIKFDNAGSNFVGFIGGVAGKNVNGTITNVHLITKYELSLNDKHYVRYKNTPVLPYSVTKNMDIPLNPDEVDFTYYSVLPDDAIISDDDRENYEDLLEATKCVTIYGRNNYKQNPDYIQDKKYYDDVKYFSYFTSAWYDDQELKKTKMTDDWISYELKPLYVLGGIAGRVVASQASQPNKDTKKTQFEKIRLDSNSIPFESTAVDIHSNYGTIIGQLDVQTTDANYKSYTGEVVLNTISANDSKTPVIGYVEYQPIDMNTTVALSNRPRHKSNDYSGPYQHTLYAIDIPFSLDMPGDDDTYNYNEYQWANINQTSGSFIGNDINNVINVISANAVDGGSTIYYDPVEIKNSKFGKESTNSVLGSNTLFVPSIYPYQDKSNTLYNTWNAAGLPSLQEQLYNEDGTNIVRYYFRHISSSNISTTSVSYFRISFNDIVFNNVNTEDMYFSYTYTSKPVEVTTDISASMFNDIKVKFEYDDKHNYYVADFTNQDGISGDNIDYSGHNYLVFGKSYSPVQIRKNINASTDGTFESMLFSAYQNSYDAEGKETKIEATNDYQLGGFLVIEKPNGSNSDDVDGNLMMFVNNDNNAEIDGRSYNLRFEQNNISTTGGGILLNIEGKS